MRSQLTTSDHNDRRWHRRRTDGKEEWTEKRRLCPFSPLPSLSVCFPIIFLMCSTTSLFVSAIHSSSTSSFSSLWSVLVSLCPHCGQFVANCGFIVVNLWPVVVISHTRSIIMANSWSYGKWSVLCFNYVISISQLFFLPAPRLACHLNVHCAIVPLPGVSTPFQCMFWVPGMARWP